MQAITKRKAYPDERLYIKDDIVVADGRTFSLDSIFRQQGAGDYLIIGPYMVNRSKIYFELKSMFREKGYFSIKIFGVSVCWSDGRYISGGRHSSFHMKKGDKLNLLSRILKEYVLIVLHTDKSITVLNQPKSVLNQPKSVLNQPKSDDLDPDLTVDFLADCKFIVAERIMKYEKYIMDASNMPVCALKMLLLYRENDSDFYKILNDIDNKDDLRDAARFSVMWGIKNDNVLDDFINARKKEIDIKAQNILIQAIENFDISLNIDDLMEQNKITDLFF